MILQPTTRTMATAFDPFSPNQESPSQGEAVSLLGLFQKQRIKHDDDEDETKSTRSSSIMSVSKRATVVEVDADDEAESIFGEAFGSQDFFIRAMHDSGELDDDIDSTGAESTERSFGEEEEGNSSSSHSSSNGFEKSKQSAFEPYSSSLDLKIIPGPMPDLLPTTRSASRESNNNKEIKIEKFVPVQPAALPKSASMSIIQEPTFLSEPAAPLQRVQRSISGESLSRSAHNGDQQKRGRSLQPRPRPATTSSQSLRGTRTTGGPLTEEEGEAFRGNFNQKIRQRSASQQQKAQATLRLGQHQQSSFEIPHEHDTTSTTTTATDKPRATSAAALLNKTNHSVSGHGEEDKIYNSNNNATTQKQRYAQQRPERKSSAQSISLVRSASASRSRSTSRSRRVAPAAVVSDDEINKKLNEEQQIEAMNARHANRAKSSSHNRTASSVSSTSEERRASGDRSVTSTSGRSSTTKNRLVSQGEDGAMTIDSQAVQDMAIKLLEKKTKEKLEKLQAAARKASKSDSPQKTRQSVSPSRKAKPTNPNNRASVSPTKSRASTSSSAPPPVPGKKSFLSDYLLTLRKGDTKQETGHNQTIILAVGHRLSSKQGVPMTKKELMDAGIFQIAKTIARMHAANGTVDQTSDKAFVDEIVKKILESGVTKNGGAPPSNGGKGPGNCFLLDYIRALRADTRKEENELNTTITQVVHRRLTSKYCVSVTEKELLVKMDVLTVVRATARMHEANKTVQITADRTFVDQVARKIMEQHFTQIPGASMSGRRSGGRRPKGSSGSTSGLNDSVSETDFSFEASSHGGQSMSSIFSKKKAIPKGSDRGESPRRRNKPASMGESMSSFAEESQQQQPQKREGSMRKARTISTSPRKERPPVNNV